MFSNQLKVIKDNGHIITAKEALARGIYRTTLCEMAKRGLLERIENSIYVDKDYVYDELEIFNLKHRDVIFSNNTAAYLHGISNRVPEKYDITTKRDNSFSLYKNQVNIYRVNDDRVDIGKITIETKTGKKVCSYNLERTFVDLIKNNRSVDLETRNYILKNIVKRDDFRIDTMREYAAIFKVKEKAEMILEVLL